MNENGKVFDGEKLTMLLADKDINDTEAGFRIGVSARTMANYRSGQEPRSYVTLCALASMLGVQPHELFKESK